MGIAQLSLALPHTYRIAWISHSRPSSPHVYPFPIQILSFITNNKWQTNFYQEKLDWPKNKIREICNVLNQDPIWAQLLIVGRSLSSLLTFVVVSRFHLLHLPLQHMSITLIFLSFLLGNLLVVFPKKSIFLGISPYAFCYFLYYILISTFGKKLFYRYSNPPSPYSTTFPSSTQF